MGINNSQIALFGTELTASVGTNTPLGPLPVSPSHIIFDNQGAASVTISLSPTGAPVWRTFPAGEAIVLDLRAANAAAPNFGPQVGTTFYATGSGTFSISYIYAQNM